MANYEILIQHLLHLCTWLLLGFFLLVACSSGQEQDVWTPLKLWNDPRSWRTLTNKRHPQNISTHIKISSQKAMQCSCSFLGPHLDIFSGASWTKTHNCSCGRNDPPSYYIINYVFFKIDHCSIWPVTTILTNLHGHLIHHPGVSKSDSQPLGPTLAERALNCSSMSRNLRAHMMSGVRRDGSNRQQLASGKRLQKHAKAAAEHFETPADRMFNVCKSPLHFSSNSWLQML